MLPLVTVQAIKNPTVCTELGKVCFNEVSSFNSVRPCICMQAGLSTRWAWQTTRRCLRS